MLGIRLVSYDAPNLLISLVFPLKQLLIPLKNKSMWIQWKQMIFRKDNAANQFRSFKKNLFDPSQEKKIPIYFGLMPLQSISP